MAATTVPQISSLEDFMANPIDGMEWVDGQLVKKYGDSEKTGMTIRHSIVQARLAFYWRNHLLSGSQGGEVCTEAPCRTAKQVRRPDVAYLSAELLT